jgi:putative tryptophan/tyrosine transport system substrate-binding protein
MKRREFITLIGSAAASPLMARAQQPAKMKRIAMVSPSEPVANMVASYHRFYRAFFDEVSRLGYVEGKNLVVERYSGGGQIDRLAQLARDVVQTNPEVIFALDSQTALQFKSTTTTIPIVALTGDPVAVGLVSNIARPGGNITGVASDAGVGLFGKLFEILREALPKLSNVCAIGPRSLWDGPYGHSIREKAKDAGISLRAAVLDGKIDEAEYQRVFAEIEQDRPDALLVGAAGVNFTNRVTIVELAAKHRLPAMYTWRDAVEIGGLIAYSFDLAGMARNGAEQVGKILGGTNPGDIPIYQATHYELAINLKTAKQLGLELPATLVGRADLVIE